MMRLLCLTRSNQIRKVHIIIQFFHNLALLISLMLISSNLNKLFSTLRGLHISDKDYYFKIS